MSDLNSRIHSPIDFLVFRVGVDLFLSRVLNTLWPSVNETKICCTPAWDLSVEAKRIAIDFLSAFCWNVFHFGIVAHRPHFQFTFCKHKVIA